MHGRDATAEDAEGVAALAGGDVDAERLIRDRSVRVADTEDGEGLAAFVAFDAWRGTVHVTRFGGDLDAVRELLDAPREFARRESLPLELVVPASDDAARDALEAEGFEDAGAGPMFEGERTRRYRWTA
jgi:hypothetical protein